MKWNHLPKPVAPVLPNAPLNILQKKWKRARLSLPLQTTVNGLAFVISKHGAMENMLPTAVLIVAPAYRKSGVAKAIKQKIFNLSREKYPEAKIFGLTTGLAVMKINCELGYEPVTYSELTQDEAFWAGCKSCVNYEI